MNLIEIAWTMMAASSITLGSIHLFVWLSGNAWVKLAYGANGVHYHVVPTP